jgi:poly [ADP-ribose] polymerase 10/14/15
MEAEFDDEVRAPKKKKLCYVRELEKEEPHSVTLNESLTVSVVSKDPTDTRLTHKFAISQKIMNAGGEGLK